MRGLFGDGQPFPKSFREVFYEVFQRRQCILQIYHKIVGHPAAEFLLGAVQSADRDDGCIHGGSLFRGIENGGGHGGLYCPLLFPGI